MSAWRRKTDTNHREVKAALETCGWRVLDLSAVGCGVPDLLATRADRWVFVEVKRPKVAGKKRGVRQNATNERQAAFAACWPVVVIERAEDVPHL